MQLPNNLSNSLANIAKIPQQKVAHAAAILLLGYIAYLIADLTWLLANPNQQMNYSANPSMISAVNQPTKTTDVSELKALNLFGEYNAVKTAPKPVVTEVKDAPETSLNLTLSGVVASFDPDVAVAVIEKSGSQETLGIGDQINGTRAMLEQVLFDRVIIKHAGKLETLMLDGVKFNKMTSNSHSNNDNNSYRPVERVDNSNNEDLNDRVNELQSALNEDPSKLLDYLKISPKTQNGETVGYLIMPGKDPEVFNAAGLISGDVAVQMNGYDLTSPLEAAQALQALKTEPEVTLLVDRNGEITEILFSIQN